MPDSVLQKNYEMYEVNDVNQIHKIKKPPNILGGFEPLAGIEPATY